MIIHHDNIRGVSSSWSGKIKVSSNTYSTGKMSRWEVLLHMLKKKEKKRKKAFCRFMGELH